MACQPGCECSLCCIPQAKPYYIEDPTPVDPQPTTLRFSVDSHEPCEFGQYDSEPFALVGDAKYWYTRAVFWKRECERKKGFQNSMNFVDEEHGGSHSGLINTDHVNTLLQGTGDQSSIGAKIQAIKYVLEVTGWGPKDSKAYVDKIVNGII
jgi:hypothetical protein